MASSEPNARSPGRPFSKSIRLPAKSHQSTRVSSGPKTKRLSKMMSIPSTFTFRSQVFSKESVVHGEDLIVTPFAQILASLRNVRNNFVALNNIQNKPKRKTSTVIPPPPTVTSPGEAMKLAAETLDELDWCLDQLETIQTHRSVSHMAFTKFQRMLNKELSQIEESKSGHQLSQFILGTFMDHEQELDLPSLQHAEELPSESNALDHSQTPHAVPSSQASPKATPKRLQMGFRFKPSSSKPPSSPASNRTIPKYGVHTSKHKELETYMSSLSKWGIDMFKVSSLTNGRPLTATVYTILTDRGLLECFNINPHHVIKYLNRIEDKYKPNPYHNAIHGADVAQGVNVLLSSQQLKSVFTDLETLAAILAAATHDVDHPGVTNQFLINTSSELAILYNDESVLENHHLAVAFQSFRENGCDMLCSLSKKQRQMIRRIMIDMVLATDMSKHMNLLADLKTTVEAKKVSGSGVLLLDNYNDRIQVLQNMIHLADLSNPTKPIDLYKEWTSRIMEEYWRQGEKEKQLGLEISPMCDRNSATLNRSQVGFIDYIVHPLWETWADLVYPDAQEMLDRLEENRDWYQEDAEDSANESARTKS